MQSDEAVRKKYLGSLDFALKFRMFSALAYVPESEVRAAFETLLESTFVKNHEQLLKPFINYSLTL